MGQDRRGRPGQAHRPPARGTGGRGAARAHRVTARRAARRQGRREHRAHPAGRVQGAGRCRPPAGEGTDDDRHQADRRHDERRARPARADHRRPPDRQDVDLHRRDHQQQGQGPDLRLRGDRPAHVGGRGRRAPAGGRGRARPHDHRRRPGRRGRADQVPGAVRRRRDGRALPLQRPARARHLRRPDQARLRLPADVAAAAPPAGPRGLPGRRLLPALAPAGALGEAERRPRRRLVHGAADHRDPGGRRVGVHPDERHLDHRRADLPAIRPVSLRRASGYQRRHLGVARGRLGPDDAHAKGGGQAAPRALPVPRAGGLRLVWLGPRRRHPGHAQPRRPAGRGAQPERAHPMGGRGPGGRDLLGHRRLPRPHQGGARPRVPRDDAPAPALRGLGPDGPDRRGQLGRLDRVAPRQLHRRGDRRLRPRLRRRGQPDRRRRVRPHRLPGGAREGGPHPAEHAPTATAETTTRTPRPRRRTSTRTRSRARRRTRRRPPPRWLH